MDANTIITDLKKHIESGIVAPGVTIEADTVLRDAGIDSFSMIEIILFIERKYGVVISDEKMLPENFKSLRTLATLVEGSLK